MTTRLFGLDERTDHMDADRPVRRHLPCGWPAMNGCEICMARAEEDAVMPCTECGGRRQLYDPEAGGWLTCWWCDGSGEES